MRDAATGYILHGLSFGVSPSNGLRNFGEIPLNTVLNTGQNSRNLATKLTKVGGVLLVGDIALSGEIKPSHVINGLMLGASMTGVGSIVAGVWFIADFGTMGVNYLINGEAKGIGDMIDESDWGKSKTVKMYDGLY